MLQDLFDAPGHDVHLVGSQQDDTESTARLGRWYR
jgi:hypothetical protein